MELREHVERQVEELFRRRATLAALAGAAIFLLLAPLDFAVFPEHARRFLALRAGVAAGLLLVGALLSRARRAAAARALVLLGAVAAAGAVEAMVLATGGAGSPYTMGMAVLGTVVLGLLPGGLAFTAILGAALLAVFLAPLALVAAAGGARHLAAEGGLFLAVLGAAAVIGRASRQEAGRAAALARDMAERELALAQEIDLRTDALLHAAAEWRAAFDAAGDLILLLGTDGRVARANRATSDLARRAPADIAGVPADALLRLLDLDGALTLLETLRRTGTRAVGELRHAPSGRWFLATAEPIAPGPGQAGGAILTLRDISDFKTMELAVLAARDEWTETFDSIREGITIHNASFTVLRANAAARRLLGRTEEEIVGRTCHEVFHGLPEPIGGCPVRASLDTSLATTVDFFEPHLGRYLEVTALPRRDGGTTHVVHDISERKQAMDELSRAALRLQGILERAPFGVFVVTEDFRVESANLAMLEMSGSTREQFVGAFLGAIPGCLEAGIAPHVQATLEGVPFRFGPAPYLRAGGRRVVGRFTGIPFEDEGRLKALVFVEDLTDLRRAEEERRSLAAMLQQAQKMEAIGTLASGIAHDFNNILLAVIGLTDAAGERLPPGHPARAELEDVVGAAERGSELVRQLLAFGRQQDLKTLPVDVNRVAAETCRMLRPMLKRDVSLVLRAAPGLPTVIADPVQLQQVLLNLALNACDAMPHGGAIEVETAAAELGEGELAHPGVPPGRYVVAGVRDTGAGIAPENLERIFEPFFTTKPPGEGSGLGLATAYGIVSQHGGALRVASEPGRGSTFRVYLPASHLEAPSPGASPSPKGGKETVLLVDDDAQARLVIGRGLERLGYRVLAAADGDEALALAGRGVDLLLCDVLIPGPGARQVAEAARSASPAVAVLFLSGHPEELLAERGLPAPGAGVVPKSLGPEGVARHVREALDRRASPLAPPGG